MKLRSLGWFLGLISALAVIYGIWTLLPSPASPIEAGQKQQIGAAIPLEKAKTEGLREVAPDSLTSDQIEEEMPSTALIEDSLPLLLSTKELETESNTAGISRGQEEATESFPAQALHLWAPAAEESCQRILRKLWKMQGGVQMPTIRIQALEGFGKPAEYDVEKREILLDPKAFQLCKQLSPQSDAALAFLLAHELVHAYQHRHLAYTSPGFFVETKTLQQWADGQKQRRHSMESQADVWGAILCHLGGYEIQQSIPRFISALYDKFHLQDEDPLYDSRQERMEIAQRAEAEAQKSIQLFDMAVYLSVLQQHDKDTTLYQYLIDNFRSPEFYHNLGLSYLRMAIPKLEEPYRSYPFPLSLDTETRLEAIASKGMRRPADLLNAALEKFDQTLSLQPLHPKARLHQAIAWQLLATVEEAQASELKNKAQQGLESILQQNAGKDAEQMLSFFQGETSPLASRLHLPPPPSGSFSGELDGVDLSQAYRLLRMDADWSSDLSFSQGIVARGFRLPHSTLTLYHDRPGAKLLALQQVNKVLDLPTGMAGKIHQVGQIISTQKRKQLRNSLPSHLGQHFLIDDSLGLVYRVTASHKVLSWCRWQSWE